MQFFRKKFKLSLKNRHAGVVALTFLKAGHGPAPCGVRDVLESDIHGLLLGEPMLDEIIIGGVIVAAPTTLGNLLFRGHAFTSR